MERRKFLKGVAVGGGAIATAGLLSGCEENKQSAGTTDCPEGQAIGAPAIKTNKRTLKMVTTWPKDFPGLGTGAQRVADRITAMTDGRLTIKLHAGGELVPPLESFDAVSEGTADLFHGASYYWKGKHPSFNFFTAVPFGLTAPELEAWVHYGGGQELWDEAGARFNLKPFLAGNTGVQMGGWFRKEVNTPEDLVGLKFRMPGLGGEVLKKLGASPVLLPGGELFQAMQTGTIDGTEWVGPWNDLAMGFYKVAKYYYYPGFHEPGSGLECTWNMDIWQSLSASDQAIVKAACSAENDIMLAEYNALNGQNLKELIEKHGVQLREFSDEIYEAYGKAAAEVLNEVATTGSDGDDLTKRTFESFKEFQNKAIEWTALSEESFAEKRRRFFKL